jgi:hypothetical protein
MASCASPDSSTTQADSSSPVTAESSAPTTATKPTVVLVHGAWGQFQLERGGHRATAEGLRRKGHLKSAGEPHHRRCQRGHLPALGQRTHRASGTLVRGRRHHQRRSGQPQCQKALVYVDAAAPDIGETNGSLSGTDSVLKQRPENELFDKLPIPGDPAGSNLYLKRDIFIHNFGNDLPADVSGRLWATQRVASTAAFRRPVTGRGMENDPILVFHQQR